jgi:thioredoxin-like negative regulator of GroEL
MTPRSRKLVAAAAVVLAAACAKRLPVPVPEGEDYLFPAPAPRELSAAETKTHREAWAEIMAGEAARAARRLEKLRRAGGGRASVEAALAYARLRAGRLEEAEAAFSSVLAGRPDWLPALVGAASTAVRQGEDERALDLYRRAQAASPQDALVRKRVGSLKLTVTEQRMARAQAALQGGDPVAARAEYEAVLAVAPEVSPVRLGLAELLAGAGEVAAAVEVLGLDPTGDRALAMRRAELLLAQREYDVAEAAYRALLSRQPADAEARAGLARTLEARQAAAMPEEYGRIPDAARATRADLAALLAARLKVLPGLGAGEPRVAVDIGGSWARESIAAVLARDLMPLYPNHTFQPGATVRRADLARAAARFLDALRWPRAAAPPPVDMSPSHLDYDAVSRALGAGVMSLTEAGSFEPWRPVSGREAIEVVDAVVRLVSP